MTEQDELVELRRADTELVLSPSVGGSVLSFRVAGVDILRPGSRDALMKSDPRQLGAFPLFPFSGRIAGGRFRCGGRDVVLRQNFPPEPHAIHGQAWQEAWRLAAADSSTATLQYDHDGSDWPWLYRAEQRFCATDRGLRLTLSLRNLSNSQMPAGLGWHPYFPICAGLDAMLSADVNEIWPSGDDMIPTHPTPLCRANDIRSPRAASKLVLDDAFHVGDGASMIRWPERGVAVTLSASPLLRHLVVFTPPGEKYFCLEPVSHVPNAVNSDLPARVTGFRLLEPGETLSANIELTVQIAS